MSAPPRRKLLDKTSQAHEVDHPKSGPSSPQDDLRIRGRNVGPLWGNRANRAVVDAQQEPLAGPVMALADADELPVGERMEGVGHADKLRRSDGMVCFRRRVTNGSRRGRFAGRRSATASCGCRRRNWLRSSMGWTGRACTRGTRWRRRRRHKTCLERLISLPNGKQI